MSQKSYKFMFLNLIWNIHNKDYSEDKLIQIQIVNKHNYLTHIINLRKIILYKIKIFNIKTQNIKFTLHNNTFD